LTAYVLGVQEKHIRDVAKVYFEAEEDSIAARESARTDEGLPLVAGSNFMAKDVRMLLRESASMKACFSQASIAH
jgi:hypothetical protein